MSSTTIAAAQRTTKDNKNQKRFLIQRIEAIGVDKKLSPMVEDALVTDLGQRAGIGVVTSAEMEQTIQFTQTKTELSCDQIESCIVEIRKKMDVDRLISGKIGKLGDELLLSLGVINVTTSTVLQRVSIQGKDFNDIKDQIGHAVDRILGKAVPKQLFRLAPGSELKLAVMPFSARGVPLSTADAMTQILSAELVQIKGVTVISRDDIDAILDKVELEAETGCTSNIDCIVEIGASLGLSKLITGTVGKIKDTYIISGQLIDTRKAEVQNRVLESYTGNQVELKNATKLVAYQLTGVDYKEHRGRIDFTLNVDEADAMLNERKVKVAENRLALKKLVPGRYSLQIMADQDSYFHFQTDVYVPPGAANIRSLTIDERPTPWYLSWWFWTITGVVITAGTATTVYFLTQEDTPLGNGTVVIAE